MADSAEPRHQGVTEQQRRHGELARSQLEGLDDWQLIGDAPGSWQAMEMQRRLMVKIELLTCELAAFRTSSDVASRKLTTLTWTLIGLTAVLVVATILLVWLTVRLVP